MEAAESKICSPVGLLTDVEFPAIFLISLYDSS